MKCKITLQERLKDLRVAHNLNLEELAKLTGISKSALGNYENDDYKEINHGNLVTLAQFYNVSTDYLLCLTENKNNFSGLSGLGICSGKNIFEKIRSSFLE